MEMSGFPTQAFPLTAVSPAMAVGLEFWDLTCGDGLCSWTPGSFHCMWPLRMGLARALWSQRSDSSCPLRSSPPEETVSPMPELDLRFWRAAGHTTLLFFRTVDPSSEEDCCVPGSVSWGRFNFWIRLLHLSPALEQQLEPVWPGFTLKSPGEPIACQSLTLESLRGRLEHL